MTTFRKTTKIEVDAQQLGRWHRSPGAFARLVPPWERMRVIEEPGEIADGARAVIKMKSGPLWMKWVAEHEDCCPGPGFTDVQVKGPFASWKHVHSFHPKAEGASELEDKISYRLPLGYLGHAFGGWLVTPFLPLSDLHNNVRRDTTKKANT